MKRELRPEETKKKGRPRAFDEAEALNKAMLVFWRYGYESTSMSVLSEELELSAPSIYAAFGDKKALFLKALDLYVGDMATMKSYIDGAPSAYEAAHELLRASVLRFTSPETPRGCMLASATASGSAESADVQLEASKKRASIESLLKARIERDITNRLLPKTASAANLAALTILIIQGLSVLARDGASRKKLLAVANSAMGGWAIR